MFSLWFPLALAPPTPLIYHMSLDTALTFRAVFVHTHQCLNALWMNSHHHRMVSSSFLGPRCSWILHSPCLLHSPLDDKKREQTLLLNIPRIGTHTFFCEVGESTFPFPYRQMDSEASDKPAVNLTTSPGPNTSFPSAGTSFSSSEEEHPWCHCKHSRTSLTTFCTCFPYHGSPVPEHRSKLCKVHKMPTSLQLCTGPTPAVILFTRLCPPLWCFSALPATFSRLMCFSLHLLS